MKGTINFNKALENGITLEKKIKIPEVEVRKIINI